MRPDPDAVLLRLTALQVSIISSGLDLIARSYSVRRSGKEPLYSYPFRLLPPPLGFNKGIYNAQFMKTVLDVWKRLRTKTARGGRFQMNAVEIRAAILGVRINLDWSRFNIGAAERLAKLAGRKPTEEEKLERKLNAATYERLNEQATKTIRSLERRMKRANSRLLSQIPHAAYNALMTRWRAHVRWMRLRFVYFKPLLNLIRRGKKSAYQQVLNDLTIVAMRGIRQEGYELPDLVQLRKIMRLYLRYTRRDRLPIPIGYLLNNEKTSGAGRVLCGFVEQRLDLVEVEE